MEASRGSPGWRSGYQIDIGEEETTLETIDLTWRTTCWLQLVVQGILDDEVHWYELVIPLMVGTEGKALSLAKCLLAVWRWSIKVLGWDICPPTPTALNIGQFMTKEEVSEGVDDHSGSWLTPVPCSGLVRWHVDGNGNGQWGRHLK